MKAKKPERNLRILEGLALFIIFILIVVFKMIPDYQKTLGSSDTFLNTETYTSLIEIKIEKGPNWILVTKDNQITNILFLNEESLLLYNQNLEKLSISKGIVQMIERLIEKNSLTKDSIIELLRYPKDVEYKSVKKELEKSLKKYDLSISLLEGETTLEKKSISLELAQTEEKEQLKAIELYSKELVRKNKNNISTATKSTLTETTAQQYIRNIYSKLETYSKTIANQAQDSGELPISLIPVSSGVELYPTTDSWYYIKDNQVYAYIKLEEETKSYSYCYKGSLETEKKGEC